MDEHAATTRISRVDEAIASFEVLFKVRRLRIRLTDPLVGILLRERGVEARANWEDVGDSVAVEDILVLGCDLVTEEEPLNDLV